MLILGVWRVLWPSSSRLWKFLTLLEDNWWWLTWACLTRTRFDDPRVFCLLNRFDALKLLVFLSSIWRGRLESDMREQVMEPSFLFFSRKLLAWEICIEKSQTVTEELIGLTLTTWDSLESLESALLLNSSSWSKDKTENRDESVCYSLIQWGCLTHNWVHALIWLSLSLIDYSITNLLLVEKWCSRASSPSSDSCVL